MKTRKEWLELDLELYEKKLISLEMFNRLPNTFIIFRNDLFNYYSREIRKTHNKINQENQKRG